MLGTILTTTAAALLLLTAAPAPASAQEQQQQQQEQQSQQDFEHKRQQLEEAAVRLGQARETLERSGEAIEEPRQQAGKALDLVGEALQQLQQTRAGDETQQAIRNAQLVIQSARQTVQSPAAQSRLAMVQALRDAEQAAQEVRSAAAAPPKPLPLAQSGETKLQQGQMLPLARAQEVIGRTARGAQGEELGQIGDVLAGPDGEARAAVLNIGGFLGIGGRKVAVDWDKVNPPAENNQREVRIDITKEELAQIPDYEEPPPVLPGSQEGQAR